MYSLTHRTLSSTLTRQSDSHPVGWLVLGVALGVLLIPDVVAAQEGPDESDEADVVRTDSTEANSPDGPLVLGLGTGRYYFVSDLPASYLNALTIREVTEGHDLDDRSSLGVRLGLRLGQRWLLEGEYVMIDTKFGLANLSSDVTYRGANVLYMLPADVFVTLGGGTVAYDFNTTIEPRIPDRNTDFALNFEFGAWTRSFLGDAFAFRVELRDYVSWFSVPGLPTRVQHHLGGLGGFEFSFP